MYMLLILYLLPMMITIMMMIMSYFDLTMHDLTVNYDVKIKVILTQNIIYNIIIKIEIKYYS